MPVQEGRKEGRNGAIVSISPYSTCIYLQLRCWHQPNLLPCSLRKSKLPGLCSPAVFIEAMKAEIRRDPARARFYVAADSVATIVAVEDAMAKFLENEGVGKTGKAGALRAAGGKLQPPVTLHLSEALLTQCDGSQRRGMACQQIALADQLLLSRTRKILRSSASSFSDAAIALHNCAPVLAPKYLGHPEPPATSSKIEELPKEMEVVSPCT